MSRAEQALAFCSAVFADGGDIDGAAQRVTVFTLPDHASRWLPVSDPAAIAAAAIEADTTAQAVYVSMAASSATPRLNASGKPKRFNAGEVTAVFGLWADLDVADGDAHAAKNLPPDEAAIRRILDAGGLKPTVFWSSGHGYQAFWRFDVPYVVETDAEREEIHKTLVAWQKTLAAHAHRLGAWRVDMVHDLARVLRVPGTTNRKTEPHVPAALVEVDESCTYTLDQLNERCLDSEWLAAMSVMTTPTGGDNGAASVDLHAVWKIAQSYRQQRYEPEWVAEVLRVLKETDTHRARRFRRMWRQSGDDSLDDHSAADASMARFVADYAGPGTEAEAMELIMCMRLRSQRKVDKVAPDGRGPSYLVSTVARVYHQAKLDEEKRLADQAASDSTTALQDREAYAVPEPEPEAALDDTSARARSLGGAAVHHLAERTGGTLPDPAGEGWHAAALENDPTPAPSSAPEPEPDPPLDPEPDEPDPRDELPPEDEPPEYDPDPDHEIPDTAQTAETAESESDPLPQDEPLDDTAPRDGVAGSDDGGDGGSPPPPPPTDPEPPADDDGDDQSNPGAGETSDPAEEPEPDYEDERERPFGAARSAWAPRREGTARALRALTADLLSRYEGNVEIWSGEQRGTGQDMKRCLILRVHRPMTVGDGEIRYSPSEPIRSGWWPSGAFNKIGTWISALEQLQFRATPIRQQDFDQRHKAALIPIWRPDSTGGNLDEIAREALANYLLDYPPVRQWEEAMALGCPWIMMRGTPWSVAGQFVVCIRWNDFARYLRGNRLGMQVGPERMADVAVALRVEDARTPEQPNRWKRLRREFFSDRVWAKVLARAEEQAATRETRAGLKLISGGRAAGGER